MNTVKRKALSCAILGGLGAAAGSAHAVYQDPNGLGQALIFPYYTVQSSSGNPFNTYLSIVNTTSQGKAVKDRFREGKNSSEVLDFNLFLSPNDVWTAAVVPADTTTTGPARIVTGDNSCTSPQIVPGGTGVDFRNYAYVGAQADNAGTGLDRTREGYVEMIEMGTVTGALLTAITHNSAGVPANCAAARVTGLGATSIAAPTGGLAGSYTLINVANGADAGGNAIALANFSAGAIYTEVGTETTNLGSADPVAVAVTNSPTGTVVYTSTFGAGRGFDAVSATMQHISVINEYALDTVTRSNTDWVMTFPTKRFYVTTAAAATPFTNKFTSSGACEAITFNFFNREEAGQQANPGDFSPTPPGASPDSLCWESTVLSIRNGASHNPTGTTSGPLGSLNTTPVNVTAGFQNGWARINFVGTNAVTTGVTSTTGTSTNVNTGIAAAAGPQVYRGLPVVGFMIRTLFNGTLSCTNSAGTAASCQGSYGSLFDHRFAQSITPSP